MEELVSYLYTMFWQIKTGPFSPAFKKNEENYFIIFLHAPQLPASNIKIADTPTRTYTTLMTTGQEPRRVSTRLNSNAPTKPQLSAPISTSTQATLCSPQQLPDIMGVELENRKLFYCNSSFKIGNYKTQGQESTKLKSIKSAPIKAEFLLKLTAFIDLVISSLSAQKL